MAMKREMATFVFSRKKTDDCRIVNHEKALEDRNISSLSPKCKNHKLNFMGHLKSQGTRTLEAIMAQEIKKGELYFPKDENVKNTLIHEFIQFKKYNIDKQIYISPILPPFLCVTWFHIIRVANAIITRSNSW